MIGELFRALGPQGRRPLVRLIGGLVLVTVLQALAMLLLVPLLRALFGTGGDPLVPLAAFVTVALVATGATVLAQRRAFLVGTEIGATLRTRLVDALDVLPRTWFRRGRAGEVSRLAGPTISGTMNIPAHFLRPLVAAVVLPLVLVGGLLLVDPVVALTFLLGAPVLAVSILLTDRMVATADRTRHELAESTAERILEFVRAQPVLRAYGRLTGDRGRLGEVLVAQRGADRRIVRQAIPGVLVHELATHVVFLAAVGVGVLRVATGAMDVADLLAVLVLGMRVVDAVSAAAALAAGMRLSRRALSGLNDVLDEAAAAVAGLAPAGPPAVGASGRAAGTAQPVTVALRGVSHRHSSARDGGTGHEERWALRGVDLDLTAPGTTALVGPSGAGKTTLAMLVARVYDPAEGFVSLDGQDVRELPTDRLLDLVAVVPQECVLLDGTLRHNLLVARPGASERELDDAVRTAGLAELVAARDGGLDAPVGPRGSMLSGGERQRVALARAVLTGAPVLVLDEVTSSLDAVHDEAITAALRRLARTRTILLVAHRLRSVVDADQVVVLEAGRVVQQGRHDELVGREGAYQRLWEAQQRAAGWQLVASDA